MVDVSHACGSSDSRSDRGRAYTSSGRDKEPSTSSSSKKRKHETGGDLVMSTELRQTVDSSKETGTDGGVTETVSQSHDDKFRNVCIEDIIILEICAGSARLTKAARGQGFRGVAIDHTNKRSCGVDICIFDLTDPAQLEDLLEYIRRDADRIALIWVAPPCGTASRARERPIPGQTNYPKPLRSTNQPDALDGLTGLEKIKVEMANQLYDAVYKITECAVGRNICVAIENPTNSHYWRTSPTRLIMEQFGDNRVTFHSCAHGGTRDKSTTSIWQSSPWFDSLALLCDGRHRHDSWRPRLQNGKMTYPTASEAACPQLLCERIIACVVSVVLSRGAITIDNFQVQNQLQESTQQRRIAMGALPRGAKIKPLVAEFQRFEVFHCDPQQQPKQIESILHTLPKGARVTHRRLLIGDAFRGSETFQSLSPGRQELVGDCVSIEACTVGVPAEPLEFLARAVKAGHPRGQKQRSFSSAPKQHASSSHFMLVRTSATQRHC